MTFNNFKQVLFLFLILCNEGCIVWYINDLYYYVFMKNKRLINYLLTCRSLLIALLYIHLRQLNKIYK